MKIGLTDGTPLTSTQYKIIQRINVLYEKARARGHTQKPLAWALYQVWKEVDNEGSEDKWMKVEEIIYHKLLRVMAMGPIIAKSDMEKLAHDAVEEIREEFRKAGVDVWPRWKGGEE